MQCGAIVLEEREIVLEDRGCKESFPGGLRCPGGDRFLSSEERVWTLLQTLPKISRLVRRVHDLPEIKRIGNCVTWFASRIGMRQMGAEKVMLALTASPSPHDVLKILILINNAVY
jgi:hypothetical protein